jgi:hypothetical protein
MTDPRFLSAPELIALAALDTTDPALSTLLGRVREHVAATHSEMTTLTRRAADSDGLVVRIAELAQTVEELENQCVLQADRLQAIRSWAVEQDDLATEYLRDLNDEDETDQAALSAAGDVYTALIEQFDQPL